MTENDEAKLDIDYKPMYQQETFDVHIQDSDGNLKQITHLTSDLRAFVLTRMLE